ncbi:MAG: aminotransferase class V-fold PLP-dependent enzyme [Nitrososphaerales archaeon]
MEIAIDMLKEDFPIIKKVAYMNNASYTPMPFYSIKAMTDFLVECSINGPDSPTVVDDIERRAKEARNEISKLLNCSADEVVLTQSTTEGLNYVANGLQWRKGETVIIRDGNHEHPANYIPWLRLKKRGVTVKKMQIDNNGFFDIKELKEAIDKEKRTRLAVFSHALFNTGSILPVAEIGGITTKKQVMFCLDQAQTIGCLPVDVKKIGCDFAAFPGSKWLCGPLGSGVFYCSKKAVEKIEPLQSGAESAFALDDERIAYKAMPDRLQTGFRNWAGMVGLTASLRYVTRLGINNIRKMNMELANMLREALKKMEHVTVYGPEEENSRTSIVSFNVNHIEAGDVVKRLEEKGIIFAKRDICRKMIVRASPHFFNQAAEIERAIEIIKKLQ